LPVKPHLTTLPEFIAVKNLTAWSHLMDWDRRTGTLYLCAF
jgi:hypothetical protein